ncbi:hypothetical protein [Streptomyces sp. NBC_00878]|uniref:hypothetical protein n=1 Tax=Streptomyces sp. NBC_00878 TaxID=2975854 RepID=UPI00225B4967|nr:hypothetical protein [Streptomyces sp. NBC_00878]MCX4905793.1 hypothetical protein [Streptomyces sp. NBC_00878]
MEQRIGPNIQPLQGAAVDPAFVPGLTGPRPAVPNDAKPQDAESKDTESKDSEETEPETEPESAEAAEKASPADESASDESASKAPALKKETSKEEVSEAEPKPKPEPELENEASGEEPSGEEPSGEESSSEESSDEDPSGEEPEEAPEGGPVFEASDRRARIVADHGGVRLRLDDQEAEFRWDEIGAVETESPRFGKRFTITVHTPDRRWYPIEIEATARSRFKEWETQLDEVLDTYFEDGEDGEEEAEVEEVEKSTP